MLKGKSGKALDEGDGEEAMEGDGEREGGGEEEESGGDKGGGGSDSEPTEVVAGHCVGEVEGG